MLVHIEAEVIEDYKYEDIIDYFNDVKKRRSSFLSVYTFLKGFILVYGFGINILFINLQGYMMTYIWFYYGQFYILSQYFVY
jgi:hypothetical protein